MDGSRGSSQMRNSTHEEKLRTTRDGTWQKGKKRKGPSEGGLLGEEDAEKMGVLPPKERKYVGPLTPGRQVREVGEFLIVSKRRKKVLGKWGKENGAGARRGEAGQKMRQVVKKGGPVGVKGGCN